MKQNRTLLLTIPVILLSTFIFLVAQTEPVEEESLDNPLAPYMNRKQPYSQKLGFAIRAKNAQLARFYVDKIDELESEIRQKVPEFEGHKIAELSRNFMPRPLRDIKAAINADDWNFAVEKYVRLIDNCNECHKATKREFIIILPSRGQPVYNQRFSPIEP